MEFVWMGYEFNMLFVEIVIGLLFDGDCVISIFYWTGDEIRDEFFLVMIFVFYMGFIYFKILMGDFKVGVMWIIWD